MIQKEDPKPKPKPRAPVKKVPAPQTPPPEPESESEPEPKPTADELWPKHWYFQTEEYEVRLTIGKGRLYH